MRTRRIIAATVSVLVMALLSSCVTGPGRHPAFGSGSDGRIGKVALAQAKSAGKGKKGVIGDVEDHYEVRFTPVDNVEEITSVYFFIDTSGLDWFDSNCLQDNSDCADFLTMFGAQQAIIGTASGTRFTTKAGTVENGEVFYFTKDFPRFNEIKDALGSGVVRFVIRTNQAEKSAFDPYSVAQFVIQVERP